MTSTSFNIGMSLERSSSKVLKPPGGGSSDIFGKDGAPEQPIAGIPRKKSQQTSSIVLSDDIMPAPIENGHSNKQDAPKTNGEAMTNGKAPKAASEAPKPAAVSNAAPRQRVPPGGFSSGLW